MDYEIQQIDIDMLKSQYNILYIKLELANIYETVNGKSIFNSNFKPIAEISGELISGSYACDSQSDSRRSLNIEFFIKNDMYEIGDNRYIWINKFIIAYIGVSNYLIENIKYYPLGIFLMDNPSYNYSASEKKLSLSCLDLYTLLNGERNGIIPAMSSTIIKGVPNINEASLLID